MKRTIDQHELPEYPLSMRHSCAKLGHGGYQPIKAEAEGFQGVAHTCSAHKVRDAQEVSLSSLMESGESQPTAYFFNKFNRVLTRAQWTRLHLGESFLRIKHVLRIIRIKSFSEEKSMSATVSTKKLTISVSSDFYEGLLRSAGSRKIGAYIEKQLGSLVASRANLKAGYQAMAADKQRESEAREWLQIGGETLKNEAW